MRAFVPLGAAVLAAVMLAATGLTSRDLAGTALEDYFYGYFFDRYPLFAFAIVYGAAGIVVAALAPSGRPAWARALSLAVALALWLAACLHPTFGGLVVRAGFATGAVMFMSQQPLAPSLAAGTAAAAAFYALVLHALEALARLRAALGWRPSLRLAARALALWWAAAVLISPAILGVEALARWPGRPPGPTTALLAGAFVLAAFLPHALIGAPRR